MLNRYQNILRDYNQEIIDLVPYNTLFFIIAAKEIEKIYKKRNKVLEIGLAKGIPHCQYSKELV